MTTPKAQALVDLAARCEAVTGADRESDYAIHERLHGQWFRQNAYIREPGDNGWYSATPPVKGANSIAAPQSYTASLDAAMSLVPALWKLRQANYSAPCADDRKWHLNLHGGPFGEDTFVGRGASQCLALCAASLRALASLEKLERVDGVGKPR